MKKLLVAPLLALCLVACGGSGSDNLQTSAVNGSWTCLPTTSYGVWDTSPRQIEIDLKENSITGYRGKQIGPNEEVEAVASRDGRILILPKGAKNREKAPILLTLRMEGEDQLYITPASTVDPDLKCKRD